MVDGSLYTFTITEGSAGRAYAPQNGDTYELTVYSDPIKTSSGTIEVGAGVITAMSGTITFDEGEPAAAPSTLTVPDSVPTDLRHTWERDDGGLTISFNSNSMTFEEDGETATATITKVEAAANTWTENNAAYPNGWTLTLTVTSSASEHFGVGTTDTETFFINGDKTKIASNFSNDENDNPGNIFIRQ